MDDKSEIKLNINNGGGILQKKNEYCDWVFVRLALKTETLQPVEVFGTIGPATERLHRFVSAEVLLWEPQICPPITVFSSSIIVWKHRCVSRVTNCTLTEEIITMDGKGEGAWGFLSSAFFSVRLHLTVRFVASEAVVYTSVSQPPGRGPYRSVASVIPRRERSSWN